MNLKACCVMGPGLRGTISIIVIVSECFVSLSRQIPEGFNLLCYVLLSVQMNSCQVRVHFGLGLSYAWAADLIF